MCAIHVYTLPFCAIATVLRPFVCMYLAAVIIQCYLILYLLGGLNPNTGAALTLFEGYDPNTDTWESLPSMKVGRYHLGAAALDRQIYAFGGIKDEHTNKLSRKLLACN